jgi:hypothetical protein
MALLPVSSFSSSNPGFVSPTYKNPLQTSANGSNGNPGASGTAPSTLSASIESETLSTQSMNIQFTSKDGDTVSFSLESMQYQKSMLQINASGSSGDTDKIMDFIKQQFKSMKAELVKSFIESQGGKVDDTGSTAPAQTGKTADAAVPAYWNAENTSQRIVDFATQFLNAFNGSSEDFLDKIKGAIEDGFKQAEGELGKLPDQVSSLVNDTHDLVMQKLDKWAEANGITAAAPATVAA